MKVAYLVSRFPHLSESFVLRELDQLEKEGIEVVLCPLLRHDEPVSHPDAARWVERAWYTPFVSRPIAADVAATTLGHPVRTLTTAGRAVAGVVPTPNFLVGTAGIAPKALHLARRLERAGVTHVHAHFATHPAMAAWLISRVTGIGYSFTAHAHDIYVDRAFLRTKVEAAQFVVTISEYNKRLLASYGGEAKTHVIHCGVDPARYRFRERPPASPFTILAVASLQPYKGLRHLVDAAALLRDRGQAFRCTIVGGGELEGALRSQVAALRLEEHVSLVGPQPQERVTELLGDADVFALPSIVTSAGKMEGLPVALMEALAAGVPAVATRISGVPELIRDGETGLLVEPGDALQLADAIERTTADPESAATRVRAGRALVEAEFDLTKNVRQLVELFRAEARP
jgi:glycosyltransferase involved in cell wall biosynthesis